MIQESRFWKKDLLRLADRLRRVRKNDKPFATGTCVAVEKAVMMGAFVVRKLAESHKLSDRTSSMSLRVTRSPSTGEPVTWMNNHRLPELFDFTKAVPARLSLWFLSNQVIHSHIFATYSDPAGRRRGVFISSDRERNRALVAVPLFEFERAFRRAGRDYPSFMRFTFDEKLRDYRVTSEEREGQRTRRD